MALLLTICSIVLCYYSPDELVPALAPYHPQIILLVPAILISVVMKSMRQWPAQMPQQALLIGFWCAVGLSFAAKLRPMAALRSVLVVGLVIGVYFLVYLNAYTLGRMRIVAAAIIGCGLALSLQGIYAYYYGGSNVMVFSTVFGTASRRICGYGILNDPNDFAQFLVVCLGLLLLFWNQNPLTRLLFVFVPMGILSYAIYLTFSRGAIFGILATAYSVISTKLNRVLSIVLLGFLFLGLLLLQFGGGRAMDLQEGSASGRLLAWGVGLALIKSSPIFGVGFGQFQRVLGSQTAHNSWVLCLAELGFVGFFFWMALLLTTLWPLERLSKKLSATTGNEEFQWHVTAVKSALYGFLATAWFLSRTYNESLYVLLAFAAVLLNLGGKLDPQSIEMRAGQWVPRTIVLQFATVVLVYVLIRLRTI
jgi:O-antigen ligase